MTKLKIVTCLVISCLVFVYFITTSDYISNMTLLSFKNFSNVQSSVMLSSYEELDIYKYYVSSESDTILYSNNNDYKSQLICSNLVLNCQVESLSNYDDVNQVGSTYNYIITGSSEELDRFIKEFKTENIFIKGTQKVFNTNSNIYIYGIVVTILLYLLIYLYKLNDLSKILILNILFGNNKREIILKLLCPIKRIAIGLSTIYCFLTLLLALSSSITIAIKTTIPLLMIMCIVIFSLLLLDIFSYYIIRYRCNIVDLLKGRLLIPSMNQLNLVYTMIIKLVVYVLIYILILLLPQVLNLIEINSLWSNVEDYSYIDNISWDGSGDIFKVLQEENNLAYIASMESESVANDVNEGYIPITLNEDLSSDIEDSLLFINKNYLDLIGFKQVPNLNANENYVLLPKAVESYETAIIFGLNDYINTHLYYTSLQNSEIISEFLDYQILYYDSYDFYAYYQRNANNILDPLLYYHDPLLYVTNPQTTSYVASKWGSNKDNFFFQVDDLDKINNLIADSNPETENSKIMDKYAQYSTLKYTFNLVMVGIILLIIPLIISLRSLIKNIFINYMLINKKQILLKRLVGVNIYKSYSNYLLFNLFTSFLMVIITLIIAITSSNILIGIITSLLVTSYFLIIDLRTIKKYEQINIVKLLKDG